MLVRTAGPVSTDMIRHTSQVTNWHTLPGVAKYDNRHRAEGTYISPSRNVVPKMIGYMAWFSTTLSGLVSSKGVQMQLFPHTDK